jgi:imidazoleglycerol phosphate dehydratase HisB
MAPRDERYEVRFRCSPDLKAELHHKAESAGVSINRALQLAVGAWNPYGGNQSSDVEMRLDGLEESLRRLEALADRSSY